MIAQLYTCDHHIYDLPVLLTWTVTHTGSVPCDSFSVSFVYEGDMGEVLEKASGFLAWDQGQIMLRGIVDEYAVELGPGGLTASVTGRGYAARLLDNESRPITYESATLSEILRNHAEPYGVTCREAADLRAGSVYTVAAGTSQWKALDSFCRTYGGFSPASPGTASFWRSPKGTAAAASPSTPPPRSSPASCGRTATAS